MESDFIFVFTDKNIDSFWVVVILVIQIFKKSWYSQNFLQSACVAFITTKKDGM